MRADTNSMAFLVRNFVLIISSNKFENFVAFRQHGTSLLSSETKDRLKLKIRAAIDYHDKHKHRIWMLWPIAKTENHEPVKISKKRCSG